MTGGRAGIRVLLAVYCRRRRHCITEVAVSPPSLCHCSRCCRRRRRRRRRRPVGDKNHGEAISERGSRSETILSAVGRSLLYRLQTYRAVSKSESKSRSKSPSARAPPPCSAPLPLRKEVEGCVIWCVAQPCIACRGGLLLRWMLTMVCLLCRVVCPGPLYQSYRCGPHPAPGRWTPRSTHPCGSGMGSACGTLGGPRSVTHDTPKSYRYGDRLSFVRFVVRPLTASAVCVCGESSSDLCPGGDPACLRESGARGGRWDPQGCGPSRGADTAFLVLGRINADTVIDTHLAGLMFLAWRCLYADITRARIEKENPDMGAV